jgi:AraC-like DNA-binding protein
MRLILENDLRRNFFNVNDEKDILEFLNLKKLAAAFGISYTTLKFRLNQGHSLQHALTLPVKNGKKGNKIKNDTEVQ